MARHESDREDLLREATALVERAELKVAGFEEPIVVGFRRDGSASFYFGADPVYQFNSALELRRAYIGGVLYKAERGRLVSLTRERGEAAVLLNRTDIGENDTAAIVGHLRDQLSTLAGALSKSQLSILGQVPADADVVKRILDWLAELPERVSIARAPNVR
jgi:hypothetical protein